TKRLSAGTDEDAPFVDAQRHLLELGPRSGEALPGAGVEAEAVPGAHEHAVVDVAAIEGEPLVGALVAEHRQAVVDVGDDEAVLVDVDPQEAAGGDRVGARAGDPTGIAAA